MSTDADQTSTPDEPTAAPVIEQETEASTPSEPIAEVASPEVSDAPVTADTSDLVAAVVADETSDSVEPADATIAPEFVEVADGELSVDGDTDTEAPGGPVEAAPTSASAIESASSPKKKDAKPGLATPAAIAPKLTPEQESELARFNAYQEAAEAVDARERAVKKAEAVKTAAATHVKALENIGNATAEEKAEAEQAYRDAVAALDAAKNGDSPAAPADSADDAPADDAPDDVAPVADGALAAESTNEPVAEADAEPGAEAVVVAEPGESAEVAETGESESGSVESESVEPEGEPASPEPVEA